MLKELFESTFYVTFPVRSGVVVALDEHVYSGDFSLVDPKACRDCRHWCSEEVSGRKQLMVRADHGLNAICVDDVMWYVNESVGPTCDYMLDDGRKVALVEMTCSTSCYATNKRQKARSQLYNTLCLFVANPNIRAHLEQMVERLAVFSWRGPLSQGDALDPVERCMKGLTSVANVVYSSDNKTKLGNGFMLLEIRYPDILRW